MENGGEGEFVVVISDSPLGNEAEVGNFSEN